MDYYADVRNAPAITILKQLKNANNTKKNLFLNTPYKNGPFNYSYAWRPTQAVTGVAMGSSTKQPSGNYTNYKGYYYGTRTDGPSTSAALYSTLVWMLELTQNYTQNDYPFNVLTSRAQSAINNVTGPDKIALQDKLNIYTTAINKYTKIVASNNSLGTIARRYDGTSSAWAGSYNKALSLDGALSTYRANLVKLSQLVANADAVVQQQAQAIVVLRQEAEGLAATANALNSNVTGAPAGTYATQIILLVQQAYAPQIAGFKALIPQIETTIKDQAEALTRALIEANLAEGTEDLINTRALINTLPSGPVKTELSAVLGDYEIQYYNQIGKGTPEDDLLAVEKMEYVYQHALLTVNKFFYNARMIEVNTVLGKLPVDTGIEMWDELTAIQSSTDLDNLDSVKIGLERLTNLLPVAESSLADVAAAQIAETIALEEAARLLELAQIAEANKQAKIADILALKQQANDLIAQLPTDIANEFIVKMNDADSGEDLSAQLGFYMALIPTLESAIAVVEDFVTNTPEQTTEAVEELTGIVYENVDNLAFATDFFVQEILAYDAASIPDLQTDTVATQGKAGGLTLPVILGGGYLLFEMLV